MVGRLGLVDDGAHAVLGLVAVEHLDLVAVLQVDAAVAAFVRDEEFDVQAEVAVFLFRDDVRGAVLPAFGGGVIGLHDGAIVDWVVGDLPFDWQR